jgi:hypothetical protein
MAVMAEFGAPHFDLPFRFKYQGDGGTAVCVEEGVIKDLVNCVYLMVLTPLGYRDEAMGFGMPDIIFGQGQVMVQSIQEQLRAEDPRIGLVFDERTPDHDAMMRHIEIAVSRRGGGPE